jgi:hypothetical protein
VGSSNILEVLHSQVSGAHDSGRNVPIRLEDCRGHATPELNTPHEAASAPAARLFLKPELNRPWSIQVRRTVDDLSFVLNLFAIVAIIGLPLLALRDNAGPQLREQPRDMRPVRDGLSVARTSSHPTLVITASQKGYVNEPLPLGIWVNDASGKETVTIAGLAAGAEVSLGISRGLTGWLLSAGDLNNLDRTFVGPPRGFVGVMNATVKLSSAGGQLLESQVIQFEWIAKTEADLRPVVEPAKPPAVVPSLPAPVVPSLNPDQIAALLKVGENLLHNGDVAAARTVLKRAATAGNARAALELGMTFDQAFLNKWGVVGFDPDLAQAREWYDRAIKLGSTEASRQLERLASMSK